jgi:hypothetical protein
MSASRASPVGLTGRVSRHGAIRAGRTGEVLVEIRGGVEAAAKAFANVDNLTVLNGAQWIAEIMNQVIAQAGPTLDLARTALHGQKNGKPSETPAP